MKRHFFDFCFFVFALGIAHQNAWASPVSVDLSKDKWSMVHEDGSKVTASGIFRSRYRVNWSPEDEETELLNAESIDFPTMEFKLKGSFWNSKLKPFFGLKGKTDDLKLMELGTAWQILDDKLAVKAGRFKIPFAREALTSAKDRTFVNKPLTKKAIPVHRDFGATVRGKFVPISFQNENYGLKMPFGYESGVFVGTSDTLAVSQFLAPSSQWINNTPAGQEDFPMPQRPYWAGRMTVKLQPQVAALEDTFIQLQGSALELGLSTKQDLGGFVELPTQAYGLDLALNSGGLTVIAETLAQFNSRDPDDASNSFEDTTHGASFETRYLFFDRIEPAMRVVDIMQGNQGTGEKSIHSHHANMGVAFYLVGRHLKWQCDVGAGFDDWNIDQTRFEAQTVLSAVF